MPGYSTRGTQTVTSGKLSLLATIRGASKRHKMYDFTVGASGTPADNAIIWTLQRISADGTGTSVTPDPLDPADGAAVTVSKSNYTIEPTYTAGAVPWVAPVNQRATYRWVAAPGSEIVVADTAGAGLGFSNLHAAYTGEAEVSALFLE